MRKEFMSTLDEFYSQDQSIYILDADCSRSTKSIILKDTDPHRFVNCGISEQNMMGVAAGLARNGKNVFVNGFAAMILQRGFDQIMQSISLPNIKLNIVGHYAGVSASKEGAPHHAILDIGLMSLLPNMNIYLPFDEEDMKNVITKVMKSKYPNYIRLSRNDNTFKLPNQINSHPFIRQFYSSEGDVCIVSYGQMLNECLEAVNCYEGDLKISLISLVDLSNYTEYLEGILKKFKFVVIVEDHVKYGGAYTHITSNLDTKGINMKHLCLTEYTETGETKWLLNKYGIDSEHILKTLNNVELEIS
ncbi:hypothetical protein KJJ36_14185 [Staphylococcus pseudoxylosus]|uniref:transketolase family protein n=1 Tax=Staphylococcus pseudoxylosus TaxID=2282419 RepID=UPI001F27B01E|nr:transketolase C-terminal domain-containing protein [Staphylococcus pseudoxylosus]MCE5003517.1 hypothetical protein [Staphylococcus pseudoxylosus]